MKMNLTASALLLTLAGTASFAQGIEGHMTGYTDDAHSDVSISTNASDETVAQHLDVGGKFSLRAEGRAYDGPTTYVTAPEDLEDGPISR